MLDNTIVRTKRGNALSRLYQEMLDTKARKIIEKRDRLNAIHSQIFSGQHTSADRQYKLNRMRQLGIKTGKAYRKYVKAERRISKGI